MMEINTILSFSVRKDREGKQIGCMFPAELMAKAHKNEREMLNFYIKKTAELLKHIEGI